MEVNLKKLPLTHFLSTLIRTNDEISYDKRSSSKGPEPETAVTGEIDGVNYAFIALERTSGIMVYDLTNPKSPNL